MTSRIAISVLLTAILFAPSLARADAQADLAAGREALQQADLDKAVTLLASAVEALPDSVEARLALAEARIRLGQIDGALVQYRAVVKLSPDHAHAKRMVAALVGNISTFEKRLGAARALMNVGQFAPALAVLAGADAQPVDAVQRNLIRHLSAECQLWSASPNDALTLAQHVIQHSEDANQVKQAHLIAALALVMIGNVTPDKIAESIAQAGELDDLWSARAAVALTLSQLDDSTRAAELSAALAGALPQIPAGGYRLFAVDRAAKLLVAAAETQVNQTNTNAALQIIWPMLNRDALPAEDVALKPVDLSSGWLTRGNYGEGHLRAVSELLQRIGRIEFSRDRNSSLRGFWLASEVHNQSPAVEGAVSVAANLASLSLPARGRNPGDVLSRADQMQRQLIINLAGKAKNNEVQAQYLGLLLGQVQRYEAAGDLATGLAQFVEVVQDGDTLKVALVGSLAQLPPGPSHQDLLNQLASAYMKLGDIAFSKSASAVVKNANPSVNQNDQVALVFYRQIAGAYPNDANYAPGADRIVARYADAGQWDLAVNALTLFHAADDQASQWAVIRLRIRQALSAENELLAARRALAAELAPLIQTNIESAGKIVADAPRKSNRENAIQIADALVSRYAGLNRMDLAEAVIATMAGAKEEAVLHDWSLWTRAGLLEAQAARALAIAVNQADDATTVVLRDEHNAEIGLLNQLITAHPASDYCVPAVDRIVRIADAYQQARAFNTAQKVLADFLKAQPTLAAAVRIEYRLVKVALAKAQDAFDRREDKTKPPAELLAGHKTAIDALAEFLKAHPTGEFSPATEDDLFAIARLYGESESWSVARTVLDQFTAAIPNFRSPAHLKLLQAATFIGELDKARGLSLLVASPPSASRPGEPGDTALAISNLPAGQTAGEASASGFGGGISIDPNRLPALDLPATPATIPSESSLAMIRETQLRQYQRIAMLEAPALEARDRGVADDQTAVPQVALPSGVLILAAEMKRQDDAADKAYAILIELVKSQVPDELAVGQRSRDEVLWLFDFFENQLRADRAIVLIKRYLVDQPGDAERVALAYRSLSDQIVWVRQRQPGETIDQAWMDARHEMFEQARVEIAAFVAANADKAQWVNEAHLLAVDSYQQEAQLAQVISAERAGGLLVRGAEAILSLLEIAPRHPQADSFPERVRGIADQIAGLGQNDQAIYVFRRLTIQIPTHDLANQALIRIAQLQSVNLNNPLRAVETYQEYLRRTDGDASVPALIFEIARQLAAQKRYLEAIHVYNVFVDSFPTDPQAPSALYAIGQTHQSNEAWQDAITTYNRIIEEYAGHEVISQVKLDTAECRINLGQWSAARKLYDEFVQQFPGHAQEATARARLDVLKKLDRFQALLADNQIDRNKDDAQFQIGRTVLLELQNPIKAIEEFRRVVAQHGKSDVADDAQIEIGRALLSLNRLDEGRAELLKVPANYVNSPLADDALFLIAQSYEQHAQRLAAVTIEKAREESYVEGQKDAYRRFNRDVAEAASKSLELREQLKKEGDEQQLAFNEVFDASRGGPNLAVSQLFCHVTQAELEAQTETALQIANRQDRINDAYREAIAMYVKAAADYPLGDKTDQSLIRIAEIFESQLNDRDAAMQTYHKIVERFPGTPVAEDAAWKVAQFYVEEGKYAQAVESYKTFIRNYPGSARVADAQFGMAEVLEQLGLWVDAMDAYEVFRQKFGSHPKVQLAADQISWIKTYRK